MKLALIDDQGTVTILDDEIEEYDLRAPMAQSMVCQAIDAAIRGALTDPKCPTCDGDTTKAGKLCWYCDDEPEQADPMTAAKAWED